MDALKAMDELARAARKDPVPKTDVSGRVLMRNRSGRPGPVLPLSLVAAAAAAAAALILFFALTNGGFSPEPMSEFFEPLEVVML